MDRMSAVASAGRTVLFVSHNLAAVAALTRRGIVLKGGQVIFRRRDRQRHRPVFGFIEQG